MIEEQQPPKDSDEDRLRVLLEGQVHCDHYLSPLADPRGKSVLVVGAGAGTEMLWCLRHGAREVVGIDILEQSPAALVRAVEELGLRPAPPWSILRLGVEEAHTLGRRFELLLSNNVFEHLSDLRRALEVCASLVEPGTGRIAVFTDPWYYSSAGSHLPVEPWAHLWDDSAALRRRLLGTLPRGHALHRLDLQDYLFREITLNRMRLPDLLEAIRANDLVLLSLRLIPDRHLRALPGCQPRLEPLRREGVSVTDLAIEGAGFELMRLGEDAPGEPPVSAESAWLAALHGQLNELARRSARLEGENALLQAAEAQARRECLLHRQAVAELKGVLDAVEASWSFRLGRLLTAPGRWMRGHRT